MYLNRIKHNVVIKLNPLTRNVGLDRQTDIQTKAISIIPHPLRGGGLITYKKCLLTALQYNNLLFRVSIGDIGHIH